MSLRCNLRCVHCYAAAGASASDDELTTDEATEYLTEHNHIIRDIIVFELRQKTEEELRALDVNTTLRKEIVDELSKQMGLDYIQNIYFNDYVVQ